jgi:hypothetical protein
MKEYHLPNRVQFNLEILNDLAYHQYTKLFNDYNSIYLCSLYCYLAIFNPANKS